MTAKHAADLYFDGRMDAAKKRLQKLKATRLIAERPRRTFDPAVLTLTKRSLELLNEHGALANYPAHIMSNLIRRLHVSDLTMRHELAVMDVKAAFHRRAKSAGHAVLEFTTWPQLIQFTCKIDGRTEVVVKPDGFFRLQPHINGRPEEHAFFLELDRSTEALRILIERALGYRHHQKSGAKPEHGHTNHFRVLYVLTSAERRNNITERLLTENPPILRLIWLSTLAEVLADPFGAIWTHPADYRDAVSGSPFRCERRKVVFRDSARDRYVDGHLKKRPLFGDN